MIDIQDPPYYDWNRPFAPRYDTLHEYLVGSITSDVRHSVDGRPILYVSSFALYPIPRERELLLMWDEVEDDINTKLEEEGSPFKVKLHKVNEEGTANWYLTWDKVHTPYTGEESDDLLDI